jgi:cyclopropane fatty-acyl-phospholipid synthase-like methyltransferase
MPFTYAPEVFDVKDIASAKQIILTPEGSTTEERWRLETPYLADLIAKALRITPGSVVLDYGCGIGRVSKALIERFQCAVVGVDISPSMIAQSYLYVQSEHFFACPHYMLSAMIERGMRFDCAFAVWVLQHSPMPERDIAIIKGALTQGARFFVLNNISRAVPTRERPWVNDGVDIKAMLSKDFRLKEEGSLPSEVTTPSLHRNTFWASFKKR